jgi:short-subunit dehydrogenase involved in D-alanine esterification of teichoic acids
MPVVLILGGGPRIGYGVGEQFKAKGYNVIIASRHPNLTAAKESGFETISLDLGDSNGIQEAFGKVSQSHGIPNVVIYNGKQGIPIVS